MKELNLRKHSNLGKGSLSCPQKQTSNELISVKECKKYFSNYMISDENAINLRNNLVGVIDSVINTYLEDFR